MTEVYTIQDNGGRPFLVTINESKINVHRFTSTSPDGLLEFKEQLLEYNRKDIIRWWVGNSPKDHLRNQGNSLLLQMDSDKYIFIGKSIFQFTLDGDTITDFISPVWGSSVPYPIAIGTHNTYFFTIGHRFDGPEDHFRYIDNKTLTTETGITLGPDMSDKMCGALYDYYYEKERSFLDGDESQIHSIEGTTIIPRMEDYPDY